MELLNKEKVIDEIMSVPPGAYYPSYFASAIRDMPPEEECGDDGERYVLTKWGCLVVTLNSYGFDIPDYITGAVGDHIVDDFMEAMQLAGYVAKREEQ